MYPIGHPGFNAYIPKFEFDDGFLAGGQPVRRGVFEPFDLVGWFFGFDGDLRRGFGRFLPFGGTFKRLPFLGRAPAGEQGRADDVRVSSEFAVVPCGAINECFSRDAASPSVVTASGSAMGQATFGDDDFVAGQTFHHPAVTKAQSTIACLPSGPRVFVEAKVHSVFGQGQRPGEIGQCVLVGPAEVTRCQAEQSNFDVGVHLPDAMGKCLLEYIELFGFGGIAVNCFVEDLNYIHQV